MKIILISVGLYSIPTMHYLAGQKMLHSVVSFGKPHKTNIPVELNAKHLNLPFNRFERDELLTGFKKMILDSQPDLVLVFGCPYKIPAELLSIPKFGFHNIHFSLLPAYRGKAPVFWQIKNGENMCGITIHQMEVGFDTGAMLAQQEIPISPADSFGLLSARLSMETVALVVKGLEKLNNTGNNLLYPQNEGEASYYPPPTTNDLRIDWEKQTAKEIENLVNATNPDYEGAIALFRGQPFRILEVNAAEVNSPSPPAPGTIVHSDTNYGIFVACKNAQYLRINVLQSPEGIFSGLKLAGMGIAAGERFETPPDLTNFSFSV